MLLERASVMMDLVRKKESERWPCVKVNIGLEPTVKLYGVQDIYEFFGENYYFDKPIDHTSSVLDPIEKYIDEQVTPNLEAVFWHPLLTFQYTFHTNRLSYNEGMRSYILLRVIRKNFSLAISRIFQNWSKIRNEKERYINAK